MMIIMMLGYTMGGLTSSSGHGDANIGQEDMFLLRIDAADALGVENGGENSDFGGPSEFIIAGGFYRLLIIIVSFMKSRI